MKRDQLILLLQPYKNVLMPKKEMSASVNRFAKLLLGLCEKYPRLRYNIALPGYIMESVDPLVMGALRDMAKRGSLEWLCMGYTEPFLSFSPLWLTGENIAAGTKTIAELTGEAPAGFMPPFSNWEPSHIDLLGGAGIRYSVISNSLMPKNEADSPGYWFTEYTGSSMAVFPARTFHRYNAPRDITGWILETFPNGAPDSAPRMAILKYLYTLNAEHKDDAEWLENISADIDKHILELQPLRFRDVLGNTPPLGLHYFPSSLVTSHNEPAPPHFLNHLHCYDQLGVMQRKLMDVCDSIRGVKEQKLAAKLAKQLFFAQDINRFLPMERSGFCSIPDRLWTYGRMIDIERELYELRDAHNGVIRLTDFLRNGYKSVIMSNKSLKLYLDHKNGGQVYELDFLERSFNACAAYNPRVRSRPNVTVPRESRLAFSDRIFAGGIAGGCAGYIRGDLRDCSNFSDSQFEYTFKNSPSGVRLLLNCNGGFYDNGRQCPLVMDKVFGLEKDLPALSYSYKLSNTSLTDYAFTFGVEIPLALPGWSRGGARVIAGKRKFFGGQPDPIVVDGISEWDIEDEEAGVRIEFVTQKNVSVWIFNPDAGASGAASNGVSLLVSCPVELEKNSSAAFTGRLIFKKHRMKGGNDDSI